MDEILNTVDKMRKLQELMGNSQQPMGTQHGFSGPPPMGPPRNYNGYQDNGFSRPWNSYGGRGNRAGFNTNSQQNYGYQQHPPLRQEVGELKEMIKAIIPLQTNGTPAMPPPPPPAVQPAQFGFPATPVSHAPEQAQQHAQHVPLTVEAVASALKEEMGLFRAELAPSLTILDNATKLHGCQIDELRKITGKMQSQQQDLQNDVKRLIDTYIDLKSKAGDQVWRNTHTNAKLSGIEKRVANHEKHLAARVQINTHRRLARGASPGKASRPIVTSDVEDEEAPGEDPAAIATMEKTFEDEEEQDEVFLTSGPEEPEADEPIRSEATPGAALQRANRRERKTPATREQAREAR